jgi:hypothetical protein
MGHIVSKCLLVALVALIMIASTSFGQQAASPPQSGQPLTGANVTEVSAPQDPPGDRLAATKGDKATQSAAMTEGLAIDPFVIAGGGGSSSGSTFALTGTIGQAAAGSVMSGGTFSISSGFWNVLETGTPVVNRRRGQLTSQ